MNTDTRNTLHRLLTFLEAHDRNYPGQVELLLPPNLKVPTLLAACRDLLDESQTPGDFPHHSPAA
jgi:hypothetical protein